GCPAAVCVEKDYENYTVPSAGGDVTRLTNNSIRDHDPYYSPDGSRIAWLAETNANAFSGAGAWDVLVMKPDGTNQTNITNDNEINSKPQWNSGSSQIYFHRMVPTTATVFNIYVMNSDGSSMNALTSSTSISSEYPSN